MSILDVIRKYQSEPFHYHGTDCCQFVGECVKAVTGRNPARSFIYSGEDAANTLIDSYGSLMDLIDQHFTKTDTLEDGLITVCLSGGRQVAGVVYRGRIIFRTQTGVADVSIGRGLGFWRA